MYTRWLAKSSLNDMRMVEIGQKISSSEQLPSLSYFFVFFLIFVSFTFFLFPPLSSIFCFFYFFYSSSFSSYPSSSQSISSDFSPSSPPTSASSCSLFAVSISYSFVFSMYKLHSYRILSCSYFVYGSFIFFFNSFMYAFADLFIGSNSHINCFIWLGYSSRPFQDCYES